MHYIRTIDMAQLSLWGSAVIGNVKLIYIT